MLLFVLELCNGTYRESLHCLAMTPRISLTVAVLIACICQLKSLVVAVQDEPDLTQYVNPFIGTEGRDSPGTVSGGGNVFPGAALPFGVVKFGIDTTAFDWTNVDANAGYTPDGYGRLKPSLACFILTVEVTGLSMLHESGTGVYVLSET
jgi:putative alpha-1,2-mannosidase